MELSRLTVNQLPKFKICQKNGIKRYSWLKRRREKALGKKVLRPKEKSWRKGRAALASNSILSEVTRS